MIKLNQMPVRLSTRFSGGDTAQKQLLTGLHGHCVRGSWEFVHQQLLKLAPSSKLDVVTSVCEKDHLQRTLLHFACAAGQPDIVSLLLSYGAEIGRCFSAGCF